MAEGNELRDPWLVAAWPGMGVVGYLAASHLAQVTGAEKVDQMPLDGWFDVEGVKISAGLVDPIARPENAIFVAKAKEAGQRDLVIFLGDEQPTQRGFAFAETLLDRIAAHDVKRVVTFASMASPVAPTAPSRVFAVATRQLLLDELGADVEHLQDGEVKGMNGLLVGAAQVRGIEGVCLMGEFPFFASAIPNPKAAAAVLQAFSQLSGIDVDVGELETRGAQVERELTQLLERLQSAAAAQLAQQQEADEGPEIEAELPEQDEDEDDLSKADRERIERLFELASADRSKALHLKSELDRLGVFKRYENRFLDLFKRAD